jgi:hypothetical protein
MTRSAVSSEYTEVDETAEIGLGGNVERWNRKFDRAGHVFVSNGISRDHQEYLALGGSGLLLGTAAFITDAKISSRRITPSMCGGGFTLRLDFSTSIIPATTVTAVRYWCRRFVCTWSFERVFGVQIRFARLEKQNRNPEPRKSFGSAGVTGSYCRCAIASALNLLLEIVGQAAEVRSFVADHQARPAARDSTIRFARFPRVVIGIAQRQSALRQQSAHLPLLLFVIQIRHGL